MMEIAIVIVSPLLSGIFAYMVARYQGKNDLNKMKVELENKFVEKFGENLLFGDGSVLENLERIEKLMKSDMFKNNNKRRRKTR